MLRANAGTPVSTYRAALAPTPAHVNYRGADNLTDGHIGFDVAVSPPIPDELKSTFLYALQREISKRLNKPSQPGRNADALEALAGLYIGPPDDSQWETTVGDDQTPVTLLPVSGDVPKRMIPGHQSQSSRPAGWLPPYVVRLVQAALNEINGLEQD